MTATHGQDRLDARGASDGQGARLLDGGALAARIKEELAERVAALREQGVQPGLGTILVGEDPGSATYVALKQRDCTEIGIVSFGEHLPDTATQNDVLDVIQRFNRDPAVDAILLQLPLPRGLDETAALLAIDPEKDVDGLHPVNLGRLVMGDPGPLPCTPAGIQEMLVAYGVPIEGRHVVIVGRGLTIGRPLALLLTLKRPAANAAVTVVHTGVPDLGAYTRQADVLVAAAGAPGLITPEMVKPGAAVIGAGVTKDGKRLLSDVAESVQSVAGWITPRLGGVGPMTRAMLLRNAVRAAERRAAAGVASPHGDAPNEMTTDTAPEPSRRADLAGRAVGLLEARRSQELAHLVEQRGGRPRIVPALREVEAVDPEALDALVSWLSRTRLDVAVFQTGVGVAGLLRHVDSLGDSAASTLRAALDGATVVARGPKPRAALGTAHVRVDLGVPSPFTTAEILTTLEMLDLAGRRVLVQHHGGSNDALMSYLRTRGAEVQEVVLYRWAMPQDTQPLVDLIAGLEAGELDALLFTSAAQVHNLFTVAEQIDQAEDLRRALCQRTLVAAVGPVCAAALSDQGVGPAQGVLQPDNPKMVPLVDAVAAFFSRAGASR